MAERIGHPQIEIKIEQRRKYTGNHLQVEANALLAGGLCYFQ
jgi:hypothetical protein